MAGDDDRLRVDLDDLVGGERGALPGAAELDHPRTHAVVAAIDAVGDRHAQLAVGIDQMERVVEPSMAVRLP